MSMIDDKYSRAYNRMLSMDFTSREFDYIFYDWPNWKESLVY